ncbi:hypothetical protein PRUPE_2G046100 [Prunus persica]|uniref:Uncharacterized protein n=1 Tax=Prunus persica TaxID=3760 RepID=A0A251QB48_PRUPE|nr:hypothetical protein PRUPE_2G046100 [Prunus persica]
MKWGGMKTRRPVSRLSSSQGDDFRQVSEAKRKNDPIIFQQTQEHCML